MKHLLFSVLFVASFVFGQEYHLPAKSPRQFIKQNFSISYIAVDYGRPSAKGRTIFGELVPYGKVWRLGANEATTIAFGQGVLIGGEAVPAGKYALYAIPNAESWTLILNKGVDNWGAYGYKEEDDVARFKVSVATINESIESLSIWFDEAASEDKKSLVIGWEKSLVTLNIEAANKDWVDQQIDTLRKAKRKK